MRQYSLPLPRFLERHTEFIGNVATLMSGKTAAAGITLLATPVVARLFPPEYFGVAALFVSIIGIVSTVAALRYEAAIVLPRAHEEAVTLMGFCYRILAGVCVLSLLFVAAYEASGARWNVLELLGPWKWLLPLGILLLGASHIQDIWLTRTKQFRLASAALVAENAVSGGSRIGFGGLLGASVYGLIVGQLLGMACRLVVQKAASTLGVRAALASMTLDQMREMARRYADFPKFNAPAGLIFVIGHHLPVLLFGALFSPAVAGFYAMAHRLSHAPVTIVATAIRRVFLQKAASIVNGGGNLHKAFLMASGGLALLGLPLFATLWLAGQPLMILLLGERWAEAGLYLEIIIPWLFMIWVMAPCNSVFIVLRAQRLWLVLQCALTGLRLGAIGVAYALEAGPEATLQAFVTVTVVANLATMAMTHVVISQHATSVRREAAARAAKQAESRGQSAG